MERWNELLATKVDMPTAERIIERRVTDLEAMLQQRVSADGGEAVRHAEALRTDTMKQLAECGNQMGAHTDRRVGELGSEVSLRLQSLEAHIAALQQRGTDMDGRLSGVQEAVDVRLRNIQEPMARAERAVTRDELDSAVRHLREVGGPLPACRAPCG